MSFIYGYDNHYDADHCNFYSDHESDKYTEDVMDYIRDSIKSGRRIDIIVYRD